MRDGTLFLRMLLTPNRAAIALLLIILAPFIIGGALTIVQYPRDPFGYIFSGVFFIIWGYFSSRKLSLDGDDVVYSIFGLAIHRARLEFLRAKFGRFDDLGAGNLLIVETVDGSWKAKFSGNLYSKSDIYSLISLLNRELR